MGRIYIKSYKVFSSSSPIEKVEWNVYSDKEKKNKIYHHIESKNDWFMKLRFNVIVDNKPYEVNQDTRAEFRVIEYSGKTSGWIDVLPNTICPTIK